MRKTKLIALLLVVALVASMVVPSVSAADSYEAYITDEAGNSEITAAAGDTVTLIVNLANNPGTSALAMKMDYPEGWTLGWFEDLELFADKAKVTFTEGESYEQKPYPMIWIMPEGTKKTREDSVGKKLSFENGELALVELDIPADAVTGTYEVILTTAGLENSNFREEVDADGVIVTGGQKTFGLTPDTSKKMTINVQGTEPEVPAGAACPEHPEVTEWTEVAEGEWNAATTLAAGHYKLMGAQSTADQILIDTGANVCIDLNGFDIAKGSGTHRIFQVSGELTVLDSTATEVDDVYTSGAIKGGRYNSSATTDLGPKGGNILVNTGATFNLYSGTVKDGAVTGSGQGSHRFGGNIYGRTGSEINVYGGVISGGTILKGSYLNSSNYHGGGNIGSFGDVNIYGGTIKDGGIDNWSHDSDYRENAMAGGNISVLAGTGLDGQINSLYISNAVVSGGYLKNDRTVAYTSSGKGSTDYTYGGNIYARGGVNVTIVDSQIIDGLALTEITLRAEKTSPYRVAYAYGGNVFVTGGDLTLSGNTVISGGKATAAVPVAEQDTSSENTKKSYGGNIYHYNGKLTISGNVTIADGTASILASDGTKAPGDSESYGGNMYLTTVTLDIDDATITGGTNYYRGGNMYITSSTGTFDNATISDGKNTLSSGRGGNIYSSHSNLTFTDCTVSGGANGGSGRGGNLCIAGDSDTVTIAGGTWTALVESGCEYGANIYATDGDSNVELIIGGGAVLNGGKARYGGNIATMYGKVTINDATIKDGTASTSGGNIYATGTSKPSTIIINNGAVIENGRLVITKNDKATVVSTLTINSGAVVDTLTTNAEVTTTIADGVKINTDPAAYMTGEATVKDGSTYTTYATVADAVAAAVAGNTVALVKDATAGAVTLNPGVTLDLNGNTLTADSVTAQLDGCQVVGGKIVSESIGLAGNNSQLPVKDGNETVLETVKFKEKQEAIDNQVTYKFYVDNEAAQTLIDNAILAGEEVAVEVKVTWTNAESQPKEKTFYLGAEDLQTLAQNWDTKMVVLTINDITGITDLTCTAQVRAGGVTVTA